MTKGWKMTEEQKKRVSEAQKKRFANPEERNKIGKFSKGRIPWNKGTKGLVRSWNKGRKGLQVAWNKGKTGIYSEETRRKISLASKGRKLSEEHKRKIKENASKNPNFGMKGKHFSEETKRKLSLSHKGQIPTNLEQLRKINLERKYDKLSEEHKKRLSETHKGKIPWNKGTKGVISAWNKGRKMPEMSGEKHPLFGKHHSEESLRKMSETHKKTMSNPEFIKKLSEIHNKRLSNPEEMKRQSGVSRKTLLRLYKSGAFPKQTNTKPERQIKEELLKRGYKEEIDFIHQYKFMNKFMCDFCFPQHKLIIEVDGDFWHANPKEYPKGSKLHSHQIKGMGRDKAKNAYIIKVDNGSWTLLRFWESDIKKDVAKCVNRIEEILKNKLTPQTN